MTDIDAFMISQFAKELVAVRLRKTEDPSTATAALVRQTLAVVLKARPAEAERVVADACYGALQALLLARRDPARAAALMLGEVVELAVPLKLNPGDLLRYALEGFARLRKLATQEQLIEMLDTVESHFHGSGREFAAALARQPDAVQRQTV